MPAIARLVAADEDTVRDVIHLFNAKGLASGVYFYRLEGAPGVDQVALATGGPMGGYSMIGVYLQNGDHVPSLDKRDPVWNATTPSYVHKLEDATVAQAMQEALG